MTYKKYKKFSNQFPKKEVTIETIKKRGSLIADHKAIIHFRDYKGYLDTIQYITLEGSRNAWDGIRSDFMYDQLMGKVKDSYSDSFGRVMNVNKILL